jgi:hypothetical protein
MATLHERVVAIERGAVQHDKQIKVIRDLVRVGMQLRVETRKDVRVLTKNVERLTSPRGTNGHVKRKLDLQ